MCLLCGLFYTKMLNSKKKFTIGTPFQALIFWAPLQTSKLCSQLILAPKSKKVCHDNVGKKLREEIYFEKKTGSS